MRVQQVSKATIALVRASGLGIVGLGLLVTAEVRLASLNVAEWQRIQAARDRVQYQPNWVRLTTGGPGGAADPSPPSAEVVALFMLRVSSLVDDLRYWNQVIESVESDNTKSVWFLGVCDSGDSCTPQEPIGFRIEGFLEAAQARPVAMAQGDLLVYRDRRFLTRLARAVEPNLTAQALVGALR